MATTVIDRITEVRSAVQSGLDEARHSVRKGLDDATSVVRKGLGETESGVRKGLDEVRSTVLGGIEAVRTPTVKFVEQATAAADRVLPGSSDRRTNLAPRVAGVVDRQYAFAIDLLDRQVPTADEAAAEQQPADQA